MSLFLLLNPKQYGDVAPAVIGGGPGGWARYVIRGEKKKKPKFKEVLVKYLKGDYGTQEEIEVEIRVSFDKVRAALIAYDQSSFEKERAKMASKLKSLLKAHETEEALNAARVIDKHIREKNRKRKRLFEEEEEFILLSMFEDDL